MNRMKENTLTSNTLMNAFFYKILNFKYIILESGSLQGDKDC